MKSATPAIPGLIPVMADCQTQSIPFLMKKAVLFFVAALSIVVYSCGGESSSGEQMADPRQDFTIVPGERIGLITPTLCTQEAVLAAYGDSARVDSVNLVEGLKGQGVVLFPNDSLRRAEIYWDPEVDINHPAFVNIVGTGGKSEWHTNEGITIGTPIEEVERLNGIAFMLSGFNWDYGGTVTDWQDGKFNTTLGLTFEPAAGKVVPDSIQGDITLRSDDPRLRAVAPVVAGMEFHFPPKNK